MMPESLVILIFAILCANGFLNINTRNQEFSFIEKYIERTFLKEVLKEVLLKTTKLQKGLTMLHYKKRKYHFLPPPPFTLHLVKPFQDKTSQSLLQECGITSTLLYFPSLYLPTSKVLLPIQLKWSQIFDSRLHESLQKL